MHRKSYCAQGAGERFELLSRAKCGLLCARSPFARTYAFAHLGYAKENANIFRPEQKSIINALLNGQLVLPFRGTKRSLYRSSNPRRTKKSKNPQRYRFGELLA